MIPQLPIEITAAIIRECAPAWKGGWGTTHYLRCGVLDGLESFSEVNKTWRALAKKESMRYMSVILPLPDTPDERRGPENLALLKERIPESNINYASLVKKLRISTCISCFEEDSPLLVELLTACRNLEEVAIFALDLKALEALSHLRYLTSLHVQNPFVPLVELGTPLSFLRHLSLEGPSTYDAFYLAPFDFLSPRYLPCLDSLSLSRIYLSSPTFLQHFLTCAAQLRQLFLAPLNQSHADHYPSQPFLIDTLPTTLLSACTSLEHLALINIDRSWPTLVFSHYTSYLPSSLRTLFLDYKEFYRLFLECLEELPPNLPNMRKILVYPFDVLEFFLEGVEDWAKWMGIDWRRLPEYENYICEEDWRPCHGRGIEVRTMQIWNDLKDTL